MHIDILGCGTIVQEGKWTNCSGYLLDHQLLFDCGPGILRALHEPSISKININHIFLSHFHVDHTSDLGPVLLNRFLDSELKNSPLNIVGPPGLVRWYGDFRKIIGNWSEGLLVKLTEIHDQPLQVGKYRIYSGLTGHTDVSSCYRVETENNSFFYSGDTGYNEIIIDLARNCHLGVIEASNSESTHIEEHLTPRLAGKIADRAGIKTLVLTHMYPEALSSDPVKEASSEFSGEILIAKEGFSLTF